MAAPSAAAEAAILGAMSTITRRCEIYQSDATTLFYAPDMISGSVSVSFSRDERRSFDLVLNNISGNLAHYPGGLWYDKIIKLYRGVSYVDPTTGLATSWETQLGEFMIDKIKSQNFPHTIAVQGRDYTKKLILDKFTQATSFASGQKAIDVIKTIAQNGGITKLIIPNTTSAPFNATLGKTWAFERGVTRWEAMKQIATAFSFDIYFDASGYMVVKAFEDPVTSTQAYTFKTGSSGNLVSFDKTTGDGRIYNHVIVTGASDSGVIPPFGEAINTSPTSPTNVSKLGHRIIEYSSSFITTNAQAAQVASDFLKIAALEEYELGLASIVLPWLEAGTVIVFTDPAPSPGDPDRFLLTDFTIPLSLGSMPLTAKRVTVVS